MRRAILILACLAVSAAPATADDTAVADVAWRILAVGPALPASDGDSEASLSFSAEEGRFAATVGCNRFVGSYTLEGDALSFGGDVAVTMMACPPPLDAAETALSDMLARTERVLRSGEVLALYGPESALLAVLIARPGPG